MQVPFFKLQKVFTLAETVFGRGQTVNGCAKEVFQGGRKVNKKMENKNSRFCKKTYFSPVKHQKKTRSGDFILLRVLLFFSG